MHHEITLPLPHVSPVTPDSPRTILFVDDDPDIRSLTRTFLEHENYRVLTSGDAGRAAHIFRSAPRVDLLITDLYMPGRSGMELAHELKAIRRDLPVIVISGGVVEAAQRIALQSQGWSFLPKPFALPQLLSTVHLILGALHSQMSTITNLLR